MSTENAIGRTYRQVSPFREIHQDCKANGNPVTVIITDGKGLMSEEDINEMYRLLGFSSPVKTKKPVSESMCDYNDYQPNMLRFKQGRRIKTFETFLDEVTRFPLPDMEVSYKNISNRECTVSGRHRIIFHQKCKSLCYPGSYFPADIRAEKDKLAVILNNEIRRRRCNKENF